MKKNLSASLEDYLEAIFNLGSVAGVAHSKDIAAALGVSKPSVTGALKLLKKRGLANYQPYNCVTLTGRGRMLGAAVAKRHDILKSFFTNVLGVDHDAAQKAACKAEHSLGPKVISRLLHFLEFVSSRGTAGYPLADEFRDFFNDRTKSELEKGRGRKDE